MTVFCREIFPLTVHFATRNTSLAKLRNSRCDKVTPVCIVDWLAGLYSTIHSVQFAIHFKSNNNNRELKSQTENFLFSCKNVVSIVNSHWWWLSWILSNHLFLIQKLICFNSLTYNADYLQLFPVGLASLQQRDPLMAFSPSTKQKQ